MSVTLHKPGFDHAIQLINRGLEVITKSNWNEVKPDRDDLVHYLDTHSMDEYGQWFLGVDTAIPTNNSSRFSYPYGDFGVLHKSGLEAIIQEAAKNNQLDIKQAAEKLLAMVNQLKR